MIVKRVSMKSVRKRGFSALVAYIVDAQSKQERVGAVFISNCRSDQPDVALTEILNTQLQNVRAKSDKTYHLIVSFRPGEQVDDATLRKIEGRLCDALGYGEHQRISAVHRDTDNLHMHIAVNKIHPTHYTMREPFNDFWILAQSCERLEREFGLEPDNHLVRKSASENRAADMEQHAGIESLIGWIQRECVEEMRKATSWTALHALMQASGLRLHESGNGLVFSADDGTMVKASSIGREFSKARMEERLGAFMPAPETGDRLPPARKYEAKPVRSRMNTSGLYAAYQEERQHAHDARLRESSEARAHKQRQVDAAKRGARFKRAAIKVSGMSRSAKKVVYAVISKLLLDDLDAIVTAYRHDRQQAAEQHPRQTWADWLQAKASDGNLEALAALRARPGVPAPQRDTLGGAGNRNPVQRLNGQDGVTKQGTVVYRLGGTTVRDDGRAMHVAGHTDAKGLQAALRMALATYGNRIHVNGSAAFKEAVVEAAVAGAMPLTFSDAALEQHRSNLSRTGYAKEKRHEQFTHGVGRPETSRVVRDRTAAAPISRKERQVVSRGGHGAESTNQPDIGAIGRHPPPERQHRLRALSELGMVRIADGSQMLLPGYVLAHLEQPRSATADQLRRQGAGPAKMSGDAASQFVREQEQRRHAGLPVQRHIAFDGAARTLPLSGTYTFRGQGLALLREGEDIVVIPVDAVTLRRLQLKPAGSSVKVSIKGITQPRSRGL